MLSCSLCFTLFLTLFHLRQLSLSVFQIDISVTLKCMYVLKLLVLSHADSVYSAQQQVWISPETVVCYFYLMNARIILHFTFFAHFLIFFVSASFFFLFPQMCSAHPCKWTSGSFLRPPGTTSLVKRKTLTKHTHMPLWVLFMWVLMDAICLSGFNLVRRFSLLKSADVKKIRNPRGPVILRLGKTALLRPTEWVYSTLSLTCSYFPAPTDKTRPAQRHLCTALGGWECITGSEIKVCFLLDFPLDSAGLCWQTLAFHAVSEQRERQRDWAPYGYSASEPSLSMSVPSNSCCVKKSRRLANDAPRVILWLHFQIHHFISLTTDTGL